MPAKPKRPVVTLNDQKLHAALDKYQQLSQAETDIKKQRDVAKDTLFELIKDYREEHTDWPRFKLGKLSFIIVKGTSASRIDGDKLLELGVNPQIIQRATIPGTEWESARATREK